MFVMSLMSKSRRSNNVNERAIVIGHFESKSGDSSDARIVNITSSQC